MDISGRVKERDVAAKQSIPLGAHIRVQIGNQQHDMGGVRPRSVRRVQEDFTTEVERQRRVGRRADVWKSINGSLDLALRSIPVEVEPEECLARELDERDPVVVTSDPRSSSNYVVDERLRRVPIVAHIRLVIAHATRTVQQDHEIHCAIVCNKTT